MGMKLSTRPKLEIWNLSQLIENHKGEGLQKQIKLIEHAVKRFEGER